MEASARWLHGRRRTNQPNEETARGGCYGGTRASNCKLGCDTCARSAACWRHRSPPRWRSRWCRRPPGWAAALAIPPSPIRSPVRTAFPAIPPATGRSAASGDSDDPGLRHVDERQRRPDDFVQDQDARRPPTTSTSSASATTAATARARSRRTQADRDAPPDPAGLPDGLVDRADRLRQLGRVGLLDRAEQRGFRRLHRPSGARRRQAAGQPDPVRRAQRREPLRHARGDLRRHLAGLQRLRRQQPLHVHGGLPARQPARLQGRLRRLLQPAVRWRVHHRRRRLLPVLRRVPDDPVPGEERLRRRATPAISDVDRAGVAAAQPQDVHVQRARRVLVGRPSAPTSRRPGTPASTWPSSAATRSSGRRAGRRAPTAPTPHIAP